MQTSDEREMTAMNERIHALELPAAGLSEATQAYFAKCEEKLGIVPNVLLSYAFDEKKLRAFTDTYNDLMLGDSGLSKLEREMIAVVVSSINHCYYCLAAHGAAVRQLFRQAHRRAGEDRGERPRRTAQGRLFRPRHLGHRLHRRLLQHVEPPRRRDRHAAQRRISQDDEMSLTKFLVASSCILRFTSPWGKGAGDASVSRVNLRVSLYRAFQLRRAG
jgi:hypothetical protein